MGRGIKCSHFGRCWIRYNFCRVRPVHFTIPFSALIINVVGLGISTIVFMIEKLINKVKNK